MQLHFEDFFCRIHFCRSVKQDKSVIKTVLFLCLRKKNVKEIQLYYFGHNNLNVNWNSVFVSIQNIRLESMNEKGTKISNM